MERGASPEVYQVVNPGRDLPRGIIQRQGLMQIAKGLYRLAFVQLTETVVTFLERVAPSLKSEGLSYHNII